MAVKLTGQTIPPPTPPQQIIVVLVNNTNTPLTFTVSGVPGQPFVLFDNNNLPVSSQGISVASNSYVSYYYYGAISITSTNNLGYWLTIP